VIALLGGCAPPGFPGVPLEGGSPACEAPREVEVVAALDGDTLVVSGAEEAAETVRLLGVDAPETGLSECWAEPAASWLAELVEGRAATLSFDGICADVFGRTLAYLWLADLSELDEEIADWAGPSPAGEAVLVNEVLLGEGHGSLFMAEELTLRPRLEEASAEAMLRDRGLFGACDER
jgi:endonuclease YncB( thermonuclease family)